MTPVNSFLIKDIQSKPIQSICQRTQKLNDNCCKVKSVFCPNHLNIKIFSAIFFKKENKLIKLYIHNTEHDITPPAIPMPDCIN